MKIGEVSQNRSGKLYNLSDVEKIRLGLKKPVAPKGTIHVVVPQHYGAKGVWWESRFVTEAELEGYVHQFPNMQILDEKYKVRRKEAEDAVH